MMSVGNLNPMRYPNYYGNSSPNPRYLTRCRSPDTRRGPGHNNYGFNSEMREVENSYVVPRVCVENPEGRRSPIGRNSLDVGYVQSRYPRRSKIVMEQKECIETDVYVEGRLSPGRRGPNENYPSRCSSPKLGQSEATIREEDEDDEVSRITRF